ncbi:hypothetical protein GWI34_03690 [Actinomadura sp. DSM 109109]|nr:hypothetical protein [Actinomadura lepetitiana]
MIVDDAAEVGHLYALQPVRQHQSLVGRELDNELVLLPAVWGPLHRIVGTLDKTLPWIFAPDHAERLAAARARLIPDDLDEPAD